MAIFATRYRYPYLAETSPVDSSATIKIATHHHLH
jgi:hypothetical protein